MSMNTDDILSRDDVLDAVEINHIADEIDRGNIDEIVSWLDDVAKCDGTETEAKLAAILRGLLLATKEPIRGYFNNDPE